MRNEELHHEMITIYDNKIELETTALTFNDELCAESGGVYYSTIKPIESKQLLASLQKTVVTSKNEPESSNIVVWSDAKNNFQKKINGDSLFEVKNLLDEKLKKLLPQSEISLRAVFVPPDEVHVLLQFQGKEGAYALPLGGAKSIASVLYMQGIELELTAPLSDIVLAPGKNALAQIKLKAKNIKKGEVVAGKIYFNTKNLREVVPVVAQGAKLRDMIRVPNLYLCSSVSRK